MAEDPTPQPQPSKDADGTAEPTPAATTPPVDPAPPVQPAATEPAPAMVPVAEPDTGYTADGVPTFEGVREKIESRFGTALGATELAEDTTEGKTAATEFEARQRAAEKKLEEIRASMYKPD